MGLAVVDRILGSPRIRTSCAVDRHAQRLESAPWSCRRDRIFCVTLQVGVQIHRLPQIRVSVVKDNIARMCAFRLPSISDVLLVRALEVVVGLGMRFPKEMLEDVPRKARCNLANVYGLRHNSSFSTTAADRNASYACRRESRQSSTSPRAVKYQQPGDRRAAPRGSNISGAGSPEGSFPDDWNAANTASRVTKTD